MDLYVNQEDRNMKEMMDNLVADETWEVPEETRNKVIKVDWQCFNLLTNLTGACKLY
jgi:hypothetical protein